MRPGESEASGRIAAVLSLGGGGAALIGLILAGASGEPYLSADGVNGWIILFAAGLLAALVAMPFALELWLRPRYHDRDRRWEVATLAWGGIALVVLAVGFLAGFDTGTLAGAAGLIAVIEAALVAGTVAFWLLAGG